MHIHAQCRYVHFVLLAFCLGAASCSKEASDADLTANGVTSVMNSSDLFHDLSKMEPEYKAQVFAKVSALSVEQYYNYVASHISNAPVMIDHRRYSGLKDQWASGHASLTALGQKYGHLGNVWQALGINPLASSVQKLNADAALDRRASTRAAQLALGDTYVANPGGSGCEDDFAYLQRTFNGSAAAIASAYSALPRDAQWGKEAVAGSGGELGGELTINGNQRKVDNAAQFSSSRYGHFANGLNYSKDFFVKCLIKPAGPTRQGFVVANFGPSPTGDKSFTDPHDGSNLSLCRRRSRIGSDSITARPRVLSTEVFR